MDDLIRIRGRVKAKLTRIINYNDQIDSQVNPAEEIQIKVEMLSDIWRDFEQTQLDIECQCSDEDLPTQQLEQEEFEDKFCKVKANLIVKLKEMQAKAIQIVQKNEDPSIIRPELHSKPHIKLPTIELPTFAGDYRKWATFNDLFNSVIHNNNSLSSVQKLHYLKSALQGDAARLVHSIAITEANYDEAWKILKDRYSNKKQIVHSHLQTLYAQPRIEHESAKELRRLIDTTTENIRALHALGLPTEHWDHLIVFLITERLDNVTRNQWELAIADNESPSFLEMKQFLEKRCRALEAGLIEKKSPIVIRPRQSTLNKSKSNVYHTTANVCSNCRENHPIYACPQFIQLPIAKRFDIAKGASLCLNCLRTGHMIKACKASHCKKCSKPHHTLLHREATGTDSQTDTTGTSIASHHTWKSNSSKQIILATAIIKVMDAQGNLQPLRALLDSGSQASFISETAVQSLHLKPQKATIAVSGLGAAQLKAIKGKVTLNLVTSHPSVNYSIQAYTLPEVTSNLPTQIINSQTLTQTINKHNLRLADPNYQTPKQIDLLIGAELFFDLLLAGQIKDNTSGVTFQNTTLGWILSGSCANSGTQEESSVSYTHCAIEDLSAQLKKFWEVEEVTITSHSTEEEQLCEEHFIQNYQRSHDGRFIVRLPMKEALTKLSSNYNMAEQRLKNMEHKLAKNTQHKQQYIQFMKDYWEMGHMELANIKTTNAYYMPHHYVIREHATTTKLRVVFDASAHPMHGLSLNNILMVGPQLQEDLINIIIRFRVHNIAFCADIEKMYRQILIHPDDRHLQRILWRIDPNQEIQDYQLKTVTYGTACAPFLAIRCLKELAKLEKQQYPLASNILSNDFYVDDVLSGANTLSEAKECKKQLVQLLSSAGFHLHKWSSNHKGLLEAISPDIINQEETIDLNKEAVKTLGILWCCKSDEFKFEVAMEQRTVKTKRTILSQVAKLFDPLGWLAPIIITAKMIIQRLWLLTIDWDTELPEEIINEWQKYKQELLLVPEFRVPRQIVAESMELDWQMHGFCDASQSAYGAVIYLRSKSQHSYCVRLVCAKSRVAPLKQISLPRLELCGALLLAQLIKSMAAVLNIPQNNIRAWTDSTIVLAWISKPPHVWKTFIANRVSEIQQTIPSHLWRHIDSKQNPADCLSRGMKPSNLKEHDLWWSGPSWLQLSNSSWPTFSSHGAQTELERRQPVTQTLNIQHTSTIMNKYSTLDRLVRITAYCCRFINHCKKTNTESTSWLSTEELRNSIYIWIREAQGQEFHSELTSCTTNTPLKKGSSLQGLNPFIDGTRILRVGGRIQEAQISYNQKHPIILHHKSKLTNLIVNATHVKHLHAGPHLLFAILRLEYWIIGAKRLINNVIYNCLKCFKLRKMTSQQLMGNLPRHRLEAQRAFLRTGIDYAGPILTRPVNRQGRHTIIKAYVCIFVCFSTKAVHFELSGSLSTESFLAALRRFSARRGYPSDIYSDCGTNFIGARRQLLELHKLVNSSDYNKWIAKKLSENGVQWHFNPPSAPHFGGLWESGVKSLKYHLRRTVGMQVLTYEELNTMLTQVEACLNSRPLCQMSDDVDNLNALTPGHFLIGEPLTNVPEPQQGTTHINWLHRWQLVQSMVKHIWSRWSREYLNRLQQRPKWAQVVPNMKVGDLVIIKESNVAPLQWAMGRIIATHPGKDGLVRTVTLKTINGQLKRPITKCCALPERDQPDN